jgi:hypothetical protein
VSHSIHGPAYEIANLLDPSCEECREKCVGDLNDKQLLALFGFAGVEFRGLTDPAGKGWTGDVSRIDPSVQARALLWAFRYAIRTTNALQVGREIAELRARGIWPFRIARPGEPL